MEKIIDSDVSEDDNDPWSDPEYDVEMVDDVNEKLTNDKIPDETVSDNKLGSQTKTNAKTKKLTKTKSLKPIKDIATKNVTNECNPQKKVDSKISKPKKTITKGRKKISSSKNISSQLLMKPKPCSEILKTKTNQINQTKSKKQPEIKVKNSQENFLPTVQISSKNRTIKRPAWLQEYQEPSLISKKSKVVT